MAPASASSTTASPTSYLPAGEAVEASPESLSWRLEEWKRTLPQRPAGGSLIAYPWDLVERNPNALRQDFLDWDNRHERGPVPAGVAVVGPAEQVPHRPGGPRRAAGGAGRDERPGADRPRRRRAGVQPAGGAVLRRPGKPRHGGEITRRQRSARTAASAARSRPVDPARLTPTRRTTASSAIPTSASGSTSAPARRSATCATTTARSPSASAAGPSTAA